MPESEGGSHCRREPLVCGGVWLNRRLSSLLAAGRTVEPFKYAYPNSVPEFSGPLLQFSLDDTPRYEQDVPRCPSFIANWTDLRLLDDPPGALDDRLVHHPAIDLHGAESLRLRLLPGSPTVAQIQDPEGNVIGLVRQ